MQATTTLNTAATIATISADTSLPVTDRVTACRAEMVKRTAESIARRAKRLLDAAKLLIGEAFATGRRELEAKARMLVALSASETRRAAALLQRAFALGA